MFTLHRKVVFLLAVCFGLAGCGDSEKAGSVAPSVSRPVPAAVAVAEMREGPAWYQATGSVVPRVSSVISGKITGTVVAVHVREGDRVTRGQVLVEIDPRQVRAGFARAEAAFAEARQAEAAAVSGLAAAAASADLARATYERYQRLIRSGSASRQEFDEVEARYRQAEAAQKQALAMADASRFRKEQAAAAVDSARISDSDSLVVAPYGGIVTARLLDPGSLASPGVPLLKLDSADSPRADILVPESRIQSVALSQTVSVTIPAAGDVVLEGMIQVIEPSADPASRSFTVQVAIPDHAAVRPGMFCRAAIPQPPVRVLMIPETAIRMQGQLTALMLVDPRNVARFRILRTGRVWDGQVEVLSGLKPGDRYVVEPPPELADGMRVEVRS